MLMGFLGLFVVLFTKETLFFTNDAFPYHSQALLDPLLLFIDYNHQHWPDELRHRECHVDGYHRPGKALILLTGSLVLG